MMLICKQRGLIEDIHRNLEKGTKIHNLNEARLKAKHGLIGERQLALAREQFEVAQIKREEEQIPFRAIMVEQSNKLEQAYI